MKGLYGKDVESILEDHTAKDMILKLPPMTLLITTHGTLDGLRDVQGSNARKFQDLKCLHHTSAQDKDLFTGNDIHQTFLCG